MLSEQDAVTYLSAPFTPCAFFPSCFITASRSLRLTHSLLYVKQSRIVPGQLGLFLRRSLPPTRTRIFVGFYLGWSHPSASLAPFDHSDQTGMYSLETRNSIISAADTSITASTFNQLFPLARANEYIWDPSRNTLSFDTQGRGWLHCPKGLPANTEITVCLGLRGDYSWDHYLYILYTRCLCSTSFLARAQLQHHWADYLTRHCQLTSPASLRKERTSSHHSYTQVLLGLVMNYQRSSSNATIRILPGMTLLTWLQQLTACEIFTSHHTFRKADKPTRPFTTRVLEQALQDTTRRLPPATNRPRRLTRLNITYNEDNNEDCCLELTAENVLPPALEYPQNQLELVPYVPLLANSVPSQDSDQSNSSPADFFPLHSSTCMSPSLSPLLDVHIDSPQSTILSTDPQQCETALGIPPDTNSIPTPTFTTSSNSTLIDPPTGETLDPMVSNVPHTSPSSYIDLSASTQDMTSSAQISFSQSMSIPTLPVNNQNTSSASLSSGLTPTYNTTVVRGTLTQSLVIPHSKVTDCQLPSLPFLLPTIPHARVHSMSSAPHSGTLSIIDTALDCPSRALSSIASRSHLISTDFPSLDPIITTINISPSSSSTNLPNSLTPSATTTIPPSYSHLSTQEINNSTSCPLPISSVINNTNHTNSASPPTSFSHGTAFNNSLRHDNLHMVPVSTVTNKIAKKPDPTQRKRLHKSSHYSEDSHMLHKRRDDKDDEPPPTSEGALSPSIPAIHSTLQSGFTSVHEGCTSRTHNADTDNALPHDILNHHCKLLYKPSTPTDGSLRVTYNNVNGLTLHKFTALLAGMIQLHTDVLCLLDTRIHKDSDVKLYRKLGKELLGPGSSIHIAPAAPSATHSSDGKSYTTAVGGQIIVKSPRITSSASFYVDPSACGVVTGLTIHIGAADILILSTYCPTASSATESAAPGALLHKLSRFLDTSPHWFHVSPLDYIFELMGGLISQHQSARSCGTICGGDFNTTWTGPHPLTHSYDSLSAWASQHHLQNSYDLLHLPHEATYTGPRGHSIIDHILCKGNLLHVQHVQVCHSPIWEISDHWPLTLTALPAGWNEPYVPRRQRRKLPTSPKPDIKRPTACVTVADHKRLNRYHTRIHQRVKCPKSSTLRTAAMYIQNLTDQAVKAARHTQRRTTKGPEGWSPEIVALNLAKTTLLEISRRMQGTYGRTRWGSQHIATQGIQHLCDVWNGHLHDLSLTCDTSHATQICSLTDHGPAYWPTVPFSLLSQALQAEVKKLGKLLHGRRRAELQHLLRTKDKVRTQNRAEGRQLKETRKFLDRDPMYWELDELLDDTGQLITDPSTLAHKATEHFHEWHARKPHATYGFHNPQVDHQRLLEDCTYFIDQHHTQTGIPIPLLRTLWTSLTEPLLDIHTKSNTQPSLHTDILALEQDPTLDEFLLTLKSMPSHSAPGPSGLTYNMILALPKQHLTALHAHLLTLWQRKHVLPTWKWRELAPLPKVLENITINDIRPLTLIETCRKVWVSIFIHRIKQFWIKHHIIHSSQHAYTAHRGVDTVHPQHRNLLEEARETCSSIYYTSWDIRRAFDRVAKPILAASWIRTGVPHSLAHYLVEFDTDGYTFVGTPYTRDILAKEGLKGFSLFEDSKAPCFQAQVGTGQGDVASPFNWNSFFDILLRALATIDTTPLYIRSTEHHLHPTEDSGFADDLISISARGESLQEKADIVSAFSIIFGLDIATQKLRAVQIHWGHENTALMNNLPLTVHHEHWTHTTQVPLLSYDHPQAKAIKYLGVLFDYDNSGRTQLASTTRQIEHDFQALHRKYSRDPLLKVEIASAGILSKARYAAKFSSWSLHVLHGIDAIFARHYRRLLLLLQGFPEELLYAPKEVGGHGLLRFSDAVNGDKHSLLHRALDAGGATKQAMLGLLHRAQRQAGATTRPGSATITPHDTDLTRPQHNASLWASSLIEWLATAGLYLSTGGEEATGTEHELLQHLSHRHHLGTPDTDIHFLNSVGLHTLGDIITPATPTTPRTIINHPSLPLHTFRQLTLPQSFLSHRPIMTPQQSWSLYPYNTVIEPLGWIFTSHNQKSTHVSFRKWILPPHLQLRPTMRSLVRRQQPTLAYTEGTQLDLSPDSYSLGAGSQCSLPFEELFPPSATLHPIYQVILSPDINKARNQGVARKVLCSFSSQLPLSDGPPNPYPPLLRFDLHQHRETLLHSTIYTDASLSHNIHPLDKFFHTADNTNSHVTAATASVIFQPSDERHLCSNTLVIRIVDGHLLPNVSAFLLEALAIVVASKLRRVIAGTSTGDPTILPIHSDCKGVISLIGGASAHLWKKPAFNLIRSINRDLPSGALHWVRSHVERRTTQQDKWTQHECGNHLADSFASATPPLRPSHHHLPTLTITATQVLHQLLREEEWIVVTATGLPFLGDPITAVKAANWTRYVDTRDRNRMLKGNPRKWSTLTLRTAAALHQTTSATYTQCSRISKLIYDWYHHGSRAVLGAKESYPEALPCPLCREPDSQFHLICGCSHHVIDKARTNILTTLTARMNRFDPYSAEYQCMYAIRTLAQPDSPVGSPHYIWLGTWSPPQIEHLRQALRDYPCDSGEASSSLLRTENYMHCTC